MRDLSTAQVTIGIGLLILSLVGCRRIGDGKVPHKENFEFFFKTELPQHISFVNYSDSHSFCDAHFIWEIGPVDDAFLEKLRRQAKLVKWDDDKPVVAGLWGNNWPEWWDQDHIYRLSEVYGRVDGKSHWYVWVDRKRNRVYLLQFNT